MENLNRKSRSTIVMIIISVIWLSLLIWGLANTHDNLDFFQYIMWAGLAAPVAIYWAIWWVLMGDK